MRTSSGCDQASGIRAPCASCAPTLLGREPMVLAMDFIALVQDVRDLQRRPGRGRRVAGVDRRSGLSGTREIDPRGPPPLLVSLAARRNCRATTIKTERTLQSPLQTREHGGRRLSVSQGEGGPHCAPRHRADVHRIGLPGTGKSLGTPGRAPDDGVRVQPGLRARKQ